MKNTKFVTLICLLCMLFSLAAPAFAVNYEPDSTSVSETAEKEDAAESSEEDDASDESDAEDAEETKRAVSSADDFFAGAGVVDAPEVTARNVLLLDMDTGVVYFSRDPDAKAYPASLTKILTVLLAVEAVERGDLDLKDEITAGKDCLDGMDEQSSTAGIVPGEKMTLENYLYCAMISSANEACNVIASTVSGSIEEFVELMNARAEELGCKGSHFVNPHGMPDDDHYTTASDLAIITREAMQHELFATICNTIERTIPSTNKSDTRELQNTNGLINKNSVMYPGYYYEPAAGVKTGHTSKAGYCLISTASQEDVHLLCIVLGADEGERANGTPEYHSFTDTVTLYRWVFDNFSRQTILGSTELVGSVHVEMGSDTDSVALRPESDIVAILPNGVNPNEYERKITVYSERDNTTLTAPISAGDVLGEVSIEKDGVVYGTAKLVASVDVAVARGAVLRSGLRAFFAHPVVLAVLAVIVLVIVLYIMMLVRYHKRQKARKRAAARARRRASEAREHEARDEILRELTRETKAIRK